MTIKLSSPEIDRYESIFNLVQLIVAHPHKSLTQHDKLRACILISFLNNEDDLTEYMYSQLTQEEHKQSLQIRKSITTSRNDWQIAY
jgi:hypothetical protein